MGNSESSNPDPVIIQVQPSPPVVHVKPFVPDYTIVSVEFSFPDRPNFGSDSIEIALCSTIKHFKKVVQTRCPFVISDYDVHYDNKIHPNNEHFQNFWCPTTIKEVYFLRPSNSAS